MIELGHFALFAAWLLALYAVIAGVFAGIRRSSRGLESAAYASIGACIACTVSLAALGYGFLTHDYSVQYVWQFSNRSMDWIYKLTAIWGGMDGSMLLWAFILSISGALLARQALQYRISVMPWAVAGVQQSLLFFLTVVLFLTNPFRYIKAPFIPPDGNGLNPLLQNPYMAVHPPLLYLGFTTMAVPFAFCIGALLSGNLSNEWLRLTRRWTLVAWGFLTAGIVLGGHWAYLELGWGGFWAWDPVENASFLPWLTATAFLHSVMVQERKNMLKFWNVLLIFTTYFLTVFGTFLTRSGVVQSVHAFAESDVGWVFLLYLALISIAAVVLIYIRRAELRSERKLESLLSREAFFLFNNLAFIGIMFATLWGVLFPVLSEKVFGEKQTVLAPYFNKVTVPLFLALIALMGVGPLIAWRKASVRNLRETFLLPLIAGVCASALLVWAGVPDFYPTLTYGLCVFVLFTIVGEFYRGMAVQRAAARRSMAASAAALFRRHRTRYGGYLVHLGVLVAAVGITASMAHKVEQDFSLAVGEEYRVGRFVLSLKGLRPIETANFTGLAADIEARRASDGTVVALLAPEIRRYRRNDESTTEVALRMSLREDLYLVLAGLDDSGQRAALKVFINPLQVWLWIGTIIMLVGTGVVLVPRRQESETPVAAAVEERA